MTNPENYAQDKTNMLNELVPHRDRIVGLDEKKQPHHSHTDEHSYIERHEQVPQELISEKSDEKTEETTSSSKLEVSKKDNENIPKVESKEQDKNAPEKDKNVLEKAKEAVVESMTSVGEKISSVGEKIKNIFS